MRNSSPLCIKQNAIYIESSEKEIVKFPEYSKDISILLKTLSPPFDKSNKLKLRFSKNTLTILKDLIETLPQAARNIHGQSVPIQGNIFQVASDIDDEKVENIVILVNSLVYKGTLSLLDQLWLNKNEFKNVFSVITKMDIPSLSNAISRFIAEKKYNLIKRNEKFIKRREEKNKKRDASYTELQPDEILLEAVQNVTGYDDSRLFKNIPKYIYLQSIDVPQQTVADYIGMNGMPPITDAHQSDEVSFDAVSEWSGYKHPHSFNNVSQCIYLQSLEQPQKTVVNYNGGNQIKLDNKNLTGLTGIELIKSKSTIRYMQMNDNFILGISQFFDSPNNPFDGFTNLYHLSLHHNQISSITTGSFKRLTQLSMLDLSQNKISSITTGTFKGLTQLKLLNLSINKISSITIGSFKRLTQLQGLVLGGNQISSITTDNLKGLTNLRDLALSQNQISSITTGTLKELTQLELLDLSENQISSITAGSFSGLTNLDELDLSKNRISSITTGNLKGLTNLSSLILRKNQISFITTDNLKELTNLSNLDLSHNQISSITTGSFNGLTQLIYLDLSQNQISSITTGTFKKLKQLFLLNLSQNKISSITAGSFSGLKNLDELVLSKNRISSITTDSFKELTNLRNLDLSKNRISSITESSFNGLTNLRDLDLSKNQISRITRGVFNVLSELLFLRLEHNYLSDTKETFIKKHRLGKYTELYYNPQHSIIPTSFNKKKHMGIGGFNSCRLPITQYRNHLCQRPSTMLCCRIQRGSETPTSLKFVRNSLDPYRPVIPFNFNVQTW